VTVGDDKKTISQILVKNTDEKLVKADPEFDAILKEVGPQTNGTGGIAYIRLELDEKGDVIKKFALTITRVTKDTKVAMGKYNETEKKWEAGEDIPKGLYGDIFKDLGAKTVYVRMTHRDDHKGIAQILVRQVGEKVKK
jgi:tRNA(Ser,Leu) C12 N-acetylase TAN1